MATPLLTTTPAPAKMYISPDTPVRLALDRAIAAGYIPQLYADNKTLRKTFLQVVRYNWRRNLQEPGPLKGNYASLMALAIARAKIGTYPAYQPEVNRLALDIAQQCFRNS